MLGFDIKGSYTDDVAIIRVGGELIRENGSISTLHGLVNEAINRSQSPQIILDLAKLTRMDSSGIGEFPAAYNAVSVKNGEIVLINPSKRVEEVLKITGLGTLFKILASEVVAREYFSYRKAGAVVTHQQPPAALQA